MTTPLAATTAAPTELPRRPPSASAAASRPGRREALRPLAVPGGRYLLAWAAAWALVGSLVAAGISFSQEDLDLGPVLLVSVLFAEVVGFTALLSARVVFPLFGGLPSAVNIGLQVLTLISGTVFGSALVLISQPLFSLARLRTVSMMVAVNAALAIVVGTALYTYDSMRRQIEASYRALREREALARELEIAREVQRELLPRVVPRLRGLDLAGACDPAVGVGGDYYDFLPFAEERLALVIADVSGKGIPAAMLMAGLQGSVRSLAMPAVSPGEVTRRLNGMLYRSTSSSRYATLFFGLYDAGRRVLTYSNAGHYPPLLLGSGGADRLRADGIPIGLLPDARYGEGRRDLRAGDLLVLYTDGIIEAPDPRGSEFGEGRLIEVLTGNSGRDLDEMIVQVFQELERWTGGGPRHDDATIVLARAV
ncbi:MAG: PP2C family protein-serine/threonine phosphatase [Acidobacteriota bacterium]